jgi:hypothetical protein
MVREFLSGGSREGESSVRSRLLLDRVEPYIQYCLFSIWEGSARKQMSEECPRAGTLRGNDVYDKGLTRASPQS